MVIIIIHLKLLNVTGNSVLIHTFLSPIGRGRIVSSVNDSDSQNRLSEFDFQPISLHSLICKYLWKGMKNSSYAKLWIK